MKSQEDKLKLLKNLKVLKTCVKWIKWVVIPLVIVGLATLVIIDLTSPEIISEEKEFQVLVYSIIILLLSALVFSVKFGVKEKWNIVLRNLQDDIRDKEIEAFNLENRVFQIKRKLSREQSKSVTSNRNPELIHTFADNLKRTYLNLINVYGDKGNALGNLMEIWKVAEVYKMELPNMRWESKGEMNKERLATFSLRKEAEGEVKRLEKVIETHAG